MARSEEREVEQAGALPGVCVCGGNHSPGALMHQVSGGLWEPEKRGLFVQGSGEVA
jgi:hypothetical protein